MSLGNATFGGFRVGWAISPPSLPRVRNPEVRGKGVRRKGQGRGVGSNKETLSFHSLRHTAVSMMEAAGIPEATGMELVGHESVEMSRLYTHTGDAELKRASLTLWQECRKEKKDEEISSLPPLSVCCFYGGFFRWTDFRPHPHTYGSGWTLDGLARCAGGPPWGLSGGRRSWRRQCQSAFAGLVALRVSFLVAQSRGGCSSPIQRVPRGWTENICPSGRPVVDKRMKARKQKGGIPAGSAALAAVPRLISAVSMKFKPNSTKVSQMSKASFSSAIPRNDTVSTQSSDTHPFGQPPSVALSQKPRPFEHLSSHSMARFFRVFWLQDAFRRRF
jgi:hypothetical protein